MLTKDAVIVYNTDEQTKQEACVIWLHGLGADGNDFAPIVPQLALPGTIRVRFVFPNAPHIPVTINGGAVMPAWYDIHQQKLNQHMDTTGLLASCKHMASIASAEADKVGWDKLVIAGFSQGGVVAAHLSEQLPKQPAGILCLSAYAMHQITPSYKPKETSALIMHGDYDTVVQVELGKELAENLQQAGFTTQYITYPMAHQVCQEQIATIGQWLCARLCQ